METLPRNPNLNPNFSLNSDMKGTFGTFGLIYCLVYNSVNYFVHLIKLFPSPDCLLSFSLHLGPTVHTEWQYNSGNSVSNTIIQFSEGLVSASAKIWKQPPLPTIKTNTPSLAAESLKVRFCLETVLKAGIQVSQFNPKLEALYCKWGTLVVLYC